jgi:AcrR family transcriptional regulator
MSPVARRRYVSVPRGQKRDALVLAAYNQLAEKGFEGLHTREVAARLHVNVATLHYYFPTKEALIRGVVEHAMQRFRSTLEPHGSPADQLRNHLRAVRKLLRSEPALGAVMGELALRSTRDPTIARILQDTSGAWHHTLRGLLRRAARDGYLDPELDTDETAALVMTTLMGMMLPPVSANDLGEQALRSLERWLNSSPEPSAGSAVRRRAGRSRE